jgi:hypothetical protein
LVQYVGEAQGHFTFAMSIYHTSTFLTAYERGAAIFVGTTVYVKIDFLSASELNMFVQNCYASPTSTSSALQYNFINSGG